MPLTFTFDLTDFNKGKLRLDQEAKRAVAQAVSEVADEVLRLSQNEIPMQTRRLANSGHVENGKNELEQIVGYNAVYAARLHEHPEYNFSKAHNPNAKGKYLEDPIKNNIGVLRQHVAKAIGA